MADRHPDMFYVSVADAYAELIDTSRHPAQDIATLTDAPITTVNRWVREARRRGLLPPASAPGRPGGPRCSCRCSVHCPPREDSDA
jgi:hypothetical protein